MPRTPLFDPAGYFAERERSSVGRAGAIVVSFWVVSTIGLTAFVQSLEPTGGSGAVSPASVYLTQTIIVSVYGVSTLWALLGVSLHYVASSIGGRGRFFDALAIGGWAFAPPQLLAPIVVPLSISLIAADRSSGFVEGVSTVVTSGLVDVSLAVLTTWTIVIWAYGLERRYDLPFASATACSAGIAGLVLLGAVALTLGVR